MQIAGKAFIPYLDAEKVEERVIDIAQRINQDYKGKYPLMVGILNGAFMFTSDLAKHLDIPVEITFMRLSSYEGESSTGEVKQLIGLGDEIRDRHVIIVEDIVDSGLTMQALLQELAKFEPASVALTALLLKPKSLQCEVNLDYLGFEIEDDFVIGYGMDYNGYGRNLNTIYQLKDS
ncbi:MAG: hypoxanthine phosphoribosyltransferase [Flammeovirgaceae bacterium]